MNEFVYLFRGDEAWRSPEQMQQQMQKWSAWMKELGDKGHVNGTDRPGRPLEPTGKVVKGKQGVITDGPYAEAKDLVGGYMLVLAKDLAQAAELSRGCPVFETGGFVEVRPVMKMNM